METWLGWFLAGISTAICLALWFWDVRKIMTTRRSTVDSAAGQLAVSREKARTGDPEAKEILVRSENIYRQAVELYNRAMKKPWIGLPGRLMGYQVIRKSV